VDIRGDNDDWIIQEERIHGMEGLQPENPDD